MDAAAEENVLNVVSFVATHYYFITNRVVASSPAAAAVAAAIVGGVVKLFCISISCRRNMIVACPTTCLPLVICRVFAVCGSSYKMYMEDAAFSTPHLPKKALVHTIGDGSDDVRVHRLVRVPHNDIINNDNSNNKLRRFI